MGRRAKGSGYLIKNEDGTKTLIRSLIHPITGKIKKMQVTAPSEARCLKLMNAKIEKWVKGNASIANAERTIVVDMCRAYLHYQESQNLIKMTTRDRNEVTIKNQIEKSILGRLQVATVTPKDIDDYFANLISAKKLSASTIEKALFVLDASFSWFVAREQLSRNPIDAIRNKIKRNIADMEASNADASDVVVLSAADEAVFITECTKRDDAGDYVYAAALHAQFLLATGLRVGEYIALRWGDYNDDKKILSISKTSHVVHHNGAYIAKEGPTKNRKARNIILRDEAVAILKKIKARESHVDIDDYICLNSKWNPHTDTTMEHIVATIYKNAGLEGRVSGLHVLRRTFATKLFREGFSIKDVAAYIGDEERTVAKYYVAARDVEEINGRTIAVVNLDNSKIRPQ